MFKQKFIDLCNQKGVSPTSVCQQIGLSNAAYSCWTETSTPRKTTLKKIADYFGVDYTYFDDESENDYTIIMIAKNYKMSNKSITISKGPAIINEYIETNDKNNEEETQAFDPEDNLTFEEIYVETYIDYLQKIKNITLESFIKYTLQNKLDNAFKECEEIYTNPEKFINDCYKKELYTKKSTVTSTTEKQTDPNDLSEQEKTLLNIFRSTTELGKQRIIQSTWNIHDEIEKKDTNSNQGNAG